MSGQFAKFMSPGLRLRCLGANGGALFAIAVAAVAALPRSTHAQEAGQPTMTQRAPESTRMMVQAFRERPTDVFLKFAEASQGRVADNARRAAEDLGRALEEVAAGDEEARREIGALLEKGARGAFARGLTMAQALDVLTSIDLMGELLHEEARAALWRELARRPSGPRRPLDVTPAKPLKNETGDAGGIDV